MGWSGLLPVLPMFGTATSAVATAIAAKDGAFSDAIFYLIVQSSEWARLT